MRVRYQIDVSDCGAAASAMLADCLGGDGDRIERDLRVEAGRDGLSLLQVRNGLRGSGVDVKAVAVRTAEGLVQLAPPFVILTAEDHFVVVLEQRPNWLRVVDPAYGWRNIGLDDEGELRFPLHAIVPDSPQPPPRRQNLREAMTDRLRQIRQVFPAGWRHVVYLLLASLLVQVGGVATSLVLRQMAGVRGAPSGWYAFAFVVALLVIEGMAVLVRELGTAKLHTIAEAPVQRRFVERLVQRPFPEHLLTRSGSILGRYATIEILFQAVYGTTVLGVGESVVGLVAFLAIGFLSPVASVAVLLVSVAAVLSSLPLKAVFARLAAHRDRCHDATMSALVDLVEQQEAIRGLGMEHGSFRAWCNAHDREVGGFMAHNRGVHLLNFAQHMFTRVVQIGAPAVALASGAPVPNVVAVLILAPMAITPVLLSARRYVRWGEIGSHWRRIETVLNPSEDEGASLEAPATTAEPDGGAVRLSVSPLGFAYPGGTTLHLNVVGEWARGQSVGVVGPSGAGKSTFARIVAGLIEPAYGTVACLDGNGRPVDLRAAVAYVPQGAAAAGDSIAEFLRGVRPDEQVGDDQLWEALGIASLVEDVRATRFGLNTRLTSAGGGLSGGQMQRLLIAGAFLSGRPIVVLDEALSGVPIELEREIVRRLRAQARLVVQITHRHESLQDADDVAVLGGNSATVTVA
jgi:ABC-type bacteriocin/lantibiotic exporter with double-glycine peptidase domain